MTPARLCRHLKIAALKMLILLLASCRLCYKSVAFENWVLVFSVLSLVSYKVFLLLFLKCFDSPSLCDKVSLWHYFSKRRPHRAVTTFYFSKTSTTLLSLTLFCQIYSSFGLFDALTPGSPSSRSEPAMAPVLWRFTETNDSIRALDSQRNLF